MYKYEDVGGLIKQGFDNFYKIPKYVLEFIEKSIVPDGWCMKVQTLKRSVTVFDNNNKIQGHIYYEAIEEMPIPQLMEIFLKKGVNNASR